MRRWLKPAAFPLLLLALNFYFVKELFSLEYSQFMGSIEAAYISISRYMLENWRDLTWFPLWYGGIPFQNTYPPLLHAVVALAAACFRISPAHAHHFVTALFYCLGPVALYGLAVRLTGSRWYSFCAALAYSLLSPSAFLIRAVRADLGTVLALRRFQALVPYGEGPHITSLTLLPAAVLCLDIALSKRKPIWYIFASIAMASVVLSNWLGAVALTMAVFAYLLAGLGGSTTPKTWLATLCAGLLAYALACQWIPPSTIRDVRYNAQFVGDFRGVYQNLPLYSALVVIALIALKYGLRRLRTPAALQFSWFFAFLTGAVTLSAEWFDVFIVPQPSRYHLEMELALCLAGAFTAKLLFDRIARTYKTAVACALLLLCCIPARRDRRYARNMVKPIHIEDTIEYKEAKWFESHAAGRRVMAPGSISFWLNAFSDTPQLGGGFAQGIVNRVNHIAQYQIYSGDGAGDRAGEITLLWCRAFGVEAIGVGGPASREVYKPARRPEMFHGLLSEAWREGDDAIYWIPQRASSLAHTVPRESLVRNSPINGIDAAQIQSYVQALDDPNLPAGGFRWTSRHSAEIQATVPPQDVLSVQIAYHPGWHASVDGSPRRLWADGLGQIVIEPGCKGLCQIQLLYDGGLEMRLARLVSWTSVAGSLIWILLSKRKR